MPSRDHYRDMSVAEALRALAEFHGDPRSRHLARDEIELLLRAAALIEHQSPSTLAFE